MKVYPDKLTSNQQSIKSPQIVPLQWKEKVSERARSESGRGRKGTEPAQREGRPDQIASNELRVKQGETEGKEEAAELSSGRSEPSSGYTGRPHQKPQGKRKLAGATWRSTNGQQSGLESIRTAGAHGDTGIYATGHLLT